MYTCTIYKICNTEDDKIYIGSTKRSLSKRMSSHRSESINGACKIHIYMREIGFRKFYIEKLEEKEVENRHEQMKLETIWMSKLSPELNINVSYSSPERTKMINSRKDKKWREKNKDKISETYKRWCLDNRGYGKEYYEKNKDRINEYRRSHHNSEKNKARCKAYRDRIK